MIERRKVRQAAAPAAADLLRALGHPLRIAIIEELAARPRCVHELVDATETSQVLVSQHLRVLRSAATVRGTRRGKEIEYSLIDPHVGHIVGDAVSHALEGQVAVDLPAHDVPDPTHEETR